MVRTPPLLSRKTYFHSCTILSNTFVFSIFLVRWMSRSFCYADLVLIFLFQGLTLLEIMSTWNDSRNILTNWQATDESPCKWTGISCHPQDQRVTSMYAPLPCFIYPILHPQTFNFSLLLYASETCLTWNWEGLYLPALVNSVDYKDCELNARLFFFFFFIYFLTQKQNRKWVKACHAKFPIFPINFFWWYRALHQNSLHGIIPYEISNCTELRAM